MSFKNKDKNMLDKIRQKIEQVMQIEELFWEEFLEHHKVIQVRKNEVLVRHSTISQDVYIIVEGSFVCSQILEDGTSKAIWCYFDEQFEVMSCLDSYFMGEQTKYELKALENSTLAKLSKNTVDNWVNKYAFFSRFYIQDVIQNFITIYEARSSLLSMSSLDFLRYSRDKFPIMFERLPSYYIADLMRITPEWYSKLQKKLDS